jgi:hypothetical protein
LREATYRRLTHLYAPIGDRARALRACHTRAAVLQRVIVVERSSATRAVYEQLLNTDTVAPIANVPSVAISLPLIGRQREWQQL